MNRTRRMEVVATLLLLLVVSVQSLPSQSLVRVVNVMRHAPQQSIDVYVDNESIPRYRGMGYLEYSNELSLTAGVHRLRIIVPNGGNDSTLSSIETMIASDSSYTVYVLGALPQLRVVSRGVDRVIGNDSLIVRCVQVTDMTEKFYVTVRDPSNFPGSVIELPLFDSQTKTWGDSIGYWKERQLVAGRMRVWLGGGGLIEDRPYTGHYREGSVVTFIIVGEYGQGNGDLRVYSLVESDTGQGALRPLREKESGDGSVRAVVVATDLFRSRVTIAGVPASGGSNVRYGFNQRIDDHLGSFNAKYMRNRVVGNGEEYDTLIDEDLYVGPTHSQPQSLSEHKPRGTAWCRCQHRCSTKSAKLVRVCASSMPQTAVVHSISS